jgi:hypothetical protein
MAVMRAIMRSLDERRSVKTRFQPVIDPKVIEPNIVVQSINAIAYNAAVQTENPGA